MRLDSSQIAQILPQSYPFLMIDRVVDFKKGESLTAIKNITGNEWMFEGHCRPTNTFPETLLIEAAAQAGLILYHMNKNSDYRRRIKYFLGKAKANFKRIVLIGDQIKIKAFANKMLDTGGYSKITISVNLCTIANIEIFYSAKEW